MDKGILLLSIGKHEYGKFAYNMALSLKHYSPKIHITLLHDDNSLNGLTSGHKQIFDNLIRLNPNDCYTEYKKQIKLDPCKAKIKLYDYTPYEHTIYLDVDGICIKDITSLLDMCVKGDFYFNSDLNGSGYLDETKWGDMVWCKPEVIRDHYKLNFKNKVPFINSSFMYFRKSDECTSLISYIKQLYANTIPLHKMWYSWGNWFPDELYYDIALGVKGLMPGLDKKVVKQSDSPVNMDDVKRDHYILGFFGIKGQHTSGYLLKVADKIIHKMMPEGVSYMKPSTLMTGKFMRT